MLFRSFLEEGFIGACSVADGAGAPRINNMWLLDTQKPIINAGDNMFKKSKTDTKMFKTSKTPAIQGILNAPSMDLVLNEQNQINVSEREAQALQHLIAQLISDGVMDSDVRRVLSAELQEVYDFAYLIGFTTQLCVYDVWLSNEGRWVTVQQSFNVSADGVVEFTSEPEEVKLMTRIVPATEMSKSGSENVNVNQMEDTMPKSKLKTQITSEGANSPAEDVSTTEAKNAAVTVESSVDTEDTKVTESIETTDSVGTKASSAVEAQSVKAPTMQEYINNAPTDFRDALQTMQNTHEARKQEIIQTIKDTGRNKFNDAYLNSQSLATLEQLQVLADVPVYAGRATPTSRTQEAADNACVPAPKVFEVKTDKAA